MAKLPRRPTTRRGVLSLLAGILVVAVAAFAAVYFLAFPTSSPKSFALATPTTPTATPADAATATGSWRIASGTQAGYRVREKLAFLPAKNDAVGRTTAVTGSAALKQAGDTVTVESAALDIDVSKLASDRAMRDQRIHQIGLQSDQYPTATFKLTKPLTLPAGAQSGETVKVPATGEFTIHGTTKEQTVPLQLRLSGTTLEAVGSLTFPWARFGMTAPSIGGFVNVEDTATMEFDLKLAKS